MATLIRQRLKSDCAVCCMAMLTGRPYEDVLAAVGDAFDPEQGMRNEQKALVRLGYRHDFAAGEPAETSDIVCLHRTFCLTPKFFRSFAWGRRALLSVPSLNIPDGWHMVYYDGQRVWDPSTLKTYAAFEQLLPDELVLFREKSA